MEMPDWVLWNDSSKCLTLEECVCLSMDSEPETEQRIPFDGGVRIVRHENAEFSGVLNTEEGRRRLALLRKHFDGGSHLLRPMNQLRYLLYGSLLETRVILCDFCCWAHAMEWDVPEPLRISPKPAPAIAAHVPVVVDVVALGGNSTLWTLERKSAARAMKDELRGQGNKAFAANTAAAFGVTATRLRDVLNDKPKKAPVKKVKGVWDV